MKKELNEDTLKRIEDIPSEIKELMEQYDNIVSDPQHYSCLDWVNLKVDLEEIANEINNHMIVGLNFKDYANMNKYQRKARKFIISDPIEAFCKFASCVTYGNHKIPFIKQLADYETYNLKSIL